MTIRLTGIRRQRERAGAQHSLRYNRWSMAGVKIQGSASAVLVLAVTSLLLLFPFIASAQEPSKYELSAGYAYMRVDSSAGGFLCTV